MGVTVREKKPGEWWIFINHHGKRTSRKIGADKKTALDVAKKIEAKLVLGDFDLAKEEKKVPTFKEYAGQWLETYVKGVRRLSTFQRYGSLLKRYAYPEIGAIPIDKITRGNVRDLLLKVRNRGLSNSVSLLRSAVSGVLSHSIDEELITVNPSIGLNKHLHLQRDKQGHLDPLNHEEVGLFLETCLKTYPEHYPFFLSCAPSGPGCV